MKSQGEKNSIDDTISESAVLIRQADGIVITAGAGMGVDSGLPDFRGNEGFWKAYPPIAKLGISFVGMANPEWFQTDPQLAWGFYGHRLNLYRSTEPHDGFDKLLQIGKTKKEGYFVFTSNVDGQFQKAGFDEERIVECHGSIHHLQCTVPCSSKIWSGEETSVDVDEKSLKAVGDLPHCGNCGALARPNILMFGDGNWISDRTYEQELRFRKWLDNNRKILSEIIVIETGAGSAVPTIRMLSESLAAEPDITLIRINPGEPDVPEGNISIHAAATITINRIFELI